MRKLHVLYLSTCICVLTAISFLGFWNYVPLGTGSYVTWSPSDAEAHQGQCEGRMHGKYNVLFITIDDLRPDMKCFGKRDVDVHSPAMDRLASKSLVLRNAFCQYPSCGPSRTTLFTGRRPDTHRVYRNAEAFSRRDGFTSMFRYFKQHGYHTHAIGKVLHYHPTSPWLSDNETWSEVPALSEGRSLDPYWKSKVSAMWTSVSESQRKKHALPDEVITKATLDKLRQLSKSQCKELFFLATGFTQPHTPIIYPVEFKRFYPIESIPQPTNSYSPSNLPNLALDRKHELKCYRNSVRDKVDDHCLRNKTTNIKLLKQAYYSSVSYVDSLVGRLLHELDVLDLAKNTIVALTADHSYMLGEHDMVQKNINLDSATRTPAMLHIPDVTDPGVASDRLVELVDFFSTLVAATGLPAVPHCPLLNAREVALCHEGMDFTPLIKNPTRPWKKAVFSQVGRAGSSIMAYSVRTETHRYTEYTRTMHPSKQTQHWRKIYAREFYDHTKDPDENINNVNHPNSQEEVSNLQKLLHGGWKAALPE